MSGHDRAALAAVVQHNCDVADAHHAQGMSLCAYLLDMREYFRWQRGLPLGAVLAKADLSAWIAGNEAHWEALRDGGETYAPVVAGADPFDEGAASAGLAADGLVVGAGLGHFGRPLFCLAERGFVERREGIEIVVAGREFARGMTAPPAVSRDGRVLIRLDAFRRWLWARFEEWRHHPHERGFAAAWAAYAEVDGREALERLAASLPDAVAAVERMALHEVGTLIEHELAEIAVGRDLAAEFGDDWDDIVDAAGSRKVEVFLRSLRDHAADCARTLPMLIERDATASIHFWFGNLEGMRRALAPGLYRAYGAWCEGERGGLAVAVAQGAGHWRRACADVVARWRSGGGAALDAAAGRLDEFAQH